MATPLSPFNTHPTSPRLSSPKQQWSALRLVGAFVLLAVFFGTSLFGFASSASARKQKARDQFEKAEQMREALNGRPEEERTRRDYQRVADAYRKVYYVAPDSSKADASVVAVAELLAEMGRQFQPGDKDLIAAIQEYEFLRREYPGSKYRFQALFTIGQIYKEDLGDQEAAHKTFEEFLVRYPHNSLAPEAKKALAELNHPKPNKKPVEEARVEPAGPPAESAAEQAAQKKTGLPMVTGIRHWSTPDYTRVAIDVDREVKYEAGRVSDPDRIFFDLPDTKLASVLVGKSFDVQDGFLKKIRVAQYQPGYTRVVLEVADVSDYSAFLLPNPYRLIIDIHGRQSQVARAQPRVATDEDDLTTAVGAKKPSPTAVRIRRRPTERQAAVARSRKLPLQPARLATRALAAASGAATPGATSARQSASNAPSRKVIIEEDEDSVTVRAPAASSKPNPPLSKSGAKPGSATTAIVATPDDSLLSSAADVPDTELKATTQPTSAPTAVAVAPRAKPAKKNSKTASDRRPRLARSRADIGW